LYKDFYKLREDPFSLTPNPRFVYMTLQHREALSGLIYSVFTRPGLTVLAGEVGTGKTLLLYTLVGLLKKKHSFVIGMCTNPALTREEFYDFVLAQFGVECPSPLKSRQLAALQEGLSKNQAEGKPCLLIVDEAQRLSSELLEEIRLLMNLETPNRKLLEIIMAGQPEMMDILRRPEFRQLKQRVSYFCKLEPLKLEELGEYICHRLSRAGLPNQTLFSQAVVEAIYTYTKGIPRLVNTLCDNALQAGFALQSPHMTIPIIEDAAKDLDMLPSAPQVDEAVEDREPPNPFLDKFSQNNSPSNGSSAERPRKQDSKIPPLRIPFEGYDARQSSLGFLARLVGRWG
jgi:general secretion pathway protein A